MTTTGKFIGINQRVPFTILDAAISQYLESGTVNQNDILAHMKEFTKGENRAMKATKYAVQIMTRQSKVLNELKKKIGQETYVKMRTGDKKALVLCLVSLTY